jgi:hypothetical protein
MFQFMGIQVVAIALIFAFPAIATWLPDYLFRSGALVVSEPPSSSSETYGESYEQMFQRSLQGLEKQ